MGLKEKQQDQRLTVEKMLLGNLTEVEPSRQMQGGDTRTRPANNVSIVNRLEQSAGRMKRRLASNCIFGLDCLARGYLPKSAALSRWLDPTQSVFPSRKVSLWRYPGR